MELSGVAGTPITKNYSLFKGIEINNSLSHEKIYFDSNSTKKGFVDSNNHLYLKRGLWFIIGCNQPDTTTLRLEFADYYTLFDKKFSSNQEVCAGDIYYQLKDERVTVSKTSQYGSIYLVPITINRKYF